MSPFKPSSLHLKLPRTSVPSARPVPVAGQPVLGSTLQEGGLELQLTLLNATTMQPLSGADNPRPQEGLFSGVAGRQFGPTARLTDKSSHTFECKVLLLSSDINDALVKIKVSRPGLAAADAADPLCVVTREFRSRARSNKSDKKNKSKFRSLSTGDDDEGATFRGPERGRRRRGRSIQEHPERGRGRGREEREGRGGKVEREERRRGDGKVRDLIYSHITS